MDRPKDIPHWAWDMAVEAADEASGPMGAIWGHEQGAPAIAKFIIQARSQAFEEAAKIADCGCNNPGCERVRILARPAYGNPGHGTPHHRVGGRSWQLSRSSQSGK